MPITTLMVHYNTPDLLRTAVSSFVSIYPEIPLLVVDNGSELGPDTEGRMTLDHLENEFGTSVGGSLTIHRLSKNIFHGPAMDLALRSLIDTPYAFILDSDTRTHTRGFLEKMSAKFSADHSTYAVGYLEKVNERGFKDPDGMPILLTPFMLIDRLRYLEHPPFIHHGQPVLANFRSAQDAGLRLQAFPIETYVDHLWRGTASRFGYKLGWKGKLNHLLNRLGL